MRSFAIALAAILFLPAVGQAQTQVPSIRDVIELSKSGLDEEVLLTLIEVNRPVYPVDAETLKTLKAGGVSPNVIVAMIRSGRPVNSEAEPGTVAESPVPTPVQPVAPVVIVEREQRVEEPRIREVAVPVPIYIPVRVGHPRDLDGRDRKRAEPVYWGFGGKLRPDAWRTAADVQKDAKVPLEPQRK